ncbi:MAG: chromosome segregation protein SMC [Clostridia bacterium]|nr:chromosome segregation protein SMC [Clostridia bacterium]
MLLKSLEIQGFKTFPDRTKLEFNNGITAVVGPNGSGKSNISDAIRWVLGEQSAKALRCSKMEDVVFNGTDKRKKVGYAEVTLTIDNKDRTLAFDGDSVAVTRRFYRSGDSDYLINKTSVRLKDIHELFMDTGLGRDGYSMISQGKIDSIVASKSEDRREIFEEASGISRYRYRKTEAERKLNQTEENLLRLRDILSELEERVGPLSKQAEKAKQYLEYAREKEGLEIALWLNTIEKSSAQLREQEDKLAVAKAQHEAAVKTLSDIESETEEIFTETGRYSSKMDEIRRINSELEKEIGEIRACISVEENNIKHSLENTARLQKSIADLDGQSQSALRDIEEKKKKIVSLESEKAAKREAFNSATLELSQIIENDGKSSELLSKFNSGIASLNVELANARASASSNRASALDLRERISSAKSAVTERAGALDLRKRELSEYRDECSELSAQYDSVSLEILEEEKTLPEKRRLRDQRKAQCDKLTLDLNEINRHKSFLENLERNLEGFAQSVKVVVREAKSGRLSGIHGPVSRVITVQPEYAVAIETALGAAMQNIVTTTEEDAKKAIAFLKQKDAGRATFLPMSTIKGRVLDERDLDRQPGFVGIASVLCQCEAQYSGILNSLLGRICIAKTLDDAVNIARHYSYRFRIVTLDGQVVNAGGSLTGGSLGKKSGLLSRVGDIEKDKQKIAAVTKMLEQSRKMLNQSEEDAAKSESFLESRKRDLAVINEDKLRAESAARSCETEIKLLEDTLSQLKSDSEELSKKLAQVEQTQKSAEECTRLLEEKIAKTQSGADGISIEIEKQTKKRETLTKMLSDIKLQMLGIDKDIESLKSEIESLKLIGSGNEEKRRQLKDEIIAENESKQKTEQLIMRYNSEEKKRRLKTAQNNETLAQLSAERAKLEQRTTRLRKLEREKSNEKETIGRELSRLEERRENLKKQYDDIIRKLWDEYELTPKTARSKAAVIESITGAQKQLATLKSKIKSLGSVNVAAIDEYKEVSERYEFLKAQVGDVEKSKKEILSLIGDLTKQMKEIFVERFALINKNFGETFKELFGGGQASLSLTNENDILGSGIDINCHPPGKIVAHLESLSGGERALVAISLYFAIMKVSPAPFCVMDEIEAALDEVNVDRFASYMRRINDKTQFILITHRRGTMEEADVLYGVTMQDEGISKLLSMKASEAAAMMKAR